LPLDHLAEDAGSNQIIVCQQVERCPRLPRQHQPRIANTNVNTRQAAAEKSETLGITRNRGNRRINLKFDDASWVEIRGRDGRTLLSQLNPAGSERSVEGKPPFSLIIGNAQHVRVSYEDRQVDLTPHVKVEVARFTLD